jgi:hypothetical protein
MKQQKENIIFKVFRPQTQAKPAFAILDPSHAPCFPYSGQRTMSQISEAGVNIFESQLKPKENFKV